MVKDIFPGPAWLMPRTLTAAGGIVYFSAVDGAHGRELWKSDGTEAGTVLVENIRLGWRASFPNGLLYIPR